MPYKISNHYLLPQHSRRQMPKPRTTWYLSRIIPFGVIWLISGSIMLLVERIAIVQEGPAPDEAIQLDWDVAIFASISIFIFGLLVGLLEVRVIDKLISGKTFLRTLLYKILLYAGIFSLVIFITFPIAASIEMSTGLSDPRVWDKYRRFFFSLTHFSTMFQLSISLILSLLYLEITDYMGRGAITNFFTGKYHEPIEEQRVFMFLDMRSSTTIAERLGHIRYFQLLKSYYACLADAVIRHGGAVYQYVGDEMIITWPLKEGIENGTCLQCYFAMQEDLEMRSSWFEDEFDVAPTFKAGLHCGEVTSGVIGVVKKEILFTGDVLNATARIQSLCNTFDTDLLISDDLKTRLPGGLQYQYSSIGEITLKGKKQEMALWSIA